MAFVVQLALSRPSLADSDTSTPIKHFIVLMQENHSFDNYFGTFPGADGIPGETCIPVQLGTRHPCIEPFHIGDNDVQSADLDHSQATYKIQLNSGSMDGFVDSLNQRNQDGRLAMGYYDERDLPFYWNIAREYVLFDRFFSSAAGGSFMNHVYWVSGGPGNGRDSLPPDGINDVKTIFDALEERNISWKFYIQNYDPALNFRTVNNYKRNRAAQVTWAPVLAMSRFLDDPKLSRRIVDLEEYYRDLERGTLPAVAYIVPSGPSEHPPSSLRSGQVFSRSLLTALMRSSAWKESAFLIAYDDWGGWFDHVRPPVVDEYGFGFRVPAMLISPYAKRGYIDHTTLDFTSILKFVEQNWQIPALAQRDSESQSMLGALDFAQPARAPSINSIGAQVKPNLVRTDVVYLVYGACFAFAASIILISRFKDRGRLRPSGDVEP